MTVVRLTKKVFLLEILKYKTEMNLQGLLPFFHVPENICIYFKFYLIDKFLQKHNKYLLLIYSLSLMLNMPILNVSSFNI